jgi:hypothetical protein
VAIKAEGGEMGVTIHFQGRARDEAALAGLLAAAEDYARAHGWDVGSLDADRTALKRVIDDVEVDYEGPVRGVVLRPHEWCEPVRLEFDDTLFVQDWTKTQFAPIEIHKAVSALLEQLAPFFESLIVNDEGDFHGGGDDTALRRHIETLDKTIAEIAAELPGRRCRVRLPTGRIADIVG